MPWNGWQEGESFAYGYDAVGNRAAQTRTITSTIVTPYTYPSTALRAGDQANRLDYFCEDGVQIDLTWDDNGNLLAQGTSVYTWDAANHRGLPLGQWPGTCKNLDISILQKP